MGAPIDDAVATQSYSCPYCRQESASVASSCPWCGAPVDVRRVTSSGWVEQPPIAQLTRIQAGRSGLQISGDVSAVAEWDLAAGDGLFFPHHTMLWQEPSVVLDTLPLSKPWTRHRAGLPMFLARATGPGRIAFSHGTSGEVIALPLQPGASVDVCEHRLLAATLGVGYDWLESGVWYTTSGRDAADQGAGVGLLRMGLELAGQEREEKAEQTRWHYPMGRFLDRFTASDQPGLVLLGAGGNAYTRVLEAGESILVKPPALLFKDPGVSATLHVEYPRSGVQFWRSWGNRYLWLRVDGPGRIGIESCYEPSDDPGTGFGQVSRSSQQVW